MTSFDLVVWAVHGVAGALGFKGVQSGFVASGPTFPWLPSGGFEVPGAGFAGTGVPGAGFAATGVCSWSWFSSPLGFLELLFQPLECLEPQRACQLPSANLQFWLRRAPCWPLLEVDLQKLLHASPCPAELFEGFRFSRNQISRSRPEFHGSRG